MRKLKQLLLVCVVLALTVCGLMACGSGKTKVGILQIATHDALDKARLGFIQALEEAGYGEDEIEIVYRNPEGDGQILGTQATDLVRRCKIVLGIGTDAAVGLQNARSIEQTDVVILFTAVTDPVSAGLVTSFTDITDITGTHDMNPIAEQIALIKEVLPSSTKLGIIYNVSEINSKVQADTAKAEAEKAGLEVRIQTVSGASEISVAASTVINNEKCDVIYLPTDNLIAANMPAIATVCEEAKVLVICGESGMLAQGGGITYSINYSVLGQITGKMAADILSGVDVSTIHVTSVDAAGVDLVVNEENLAAIGVTLPESITSKLEK